MTSIHKLTGISEPVQCSDHEKEARLNKPSKNIEAIQHETINEIAFSCEELDLLEQASSLLKSKLHHGNALTSVNIVKEYCRFSFAHLEYEVFSVLLLNNKHELITTSSLFRGSISSATIYPREVLREVLKYNAAAVILTHNHPSASTEPSQTDIRITQELVNLLKLVDVQVLDHIIVGLDDCSSFAELGLV